MGRGLPPDMALAALSSAFGALRSGPEAGLLPRPLREVLAESPPPCRGFPSDPHVTSSPPPGLSSLLVAVAVVLPSGLSFRYSSGPVWVSASTMSLPRSLGLGGRCASVRSCHFPRATILGSSAVSLGPCAKTCRSVCESRACAANGMGICDLRGRASSVSYSPSAPLPACCPQTPL